MPSEVSRALQDAFRLVEGLRDDLLSSHERAHALLERVTQMASVHDQIAAIFDDLEPKVSALVAAKTSSDSANADLLTRAQALQSVVDKAVADLAPVSSGQHG